MELRKDYILDRWVIIASNRGKRPIQFKQPVVKEKVDKCFFCPGSEGLTPPEIGRIKNGKSWKIRWFPNKFNAVDKEGSYQIRTDNTFFTFSDAFGKHEVIAETSNHDKQLWDLDVDHVKDLLGVYSSRISELSSEEGIQYVSLFKNHGKAAGTSILHSHTQIISYNIVPKNVREKVEAVKNFPGCPYCQIIDIEKDGARKCFENDSFLAFTPYASRFNFEVWIFPKNHIQNITQMNDHSDLAEILVKVLGKLKSLNAAFNMYLHYSPSGEDLHFHIEICPRIANWAGFEFSTGTIINSVSPEDAGKFYRGEE